MLTVRVLTIEYDDSSEWDGVAICISLWQDFKGPVNDTASPGFLVFERQISLSFQKFTLVLVLQL
jgi:hypothetical protein